MNLVILDGYTENPGDLSWEWLSDIVDSYKVYDKTAPEQVVERAKDAEIVVTNKVVLSREIINSLPKLKFIAVLATGFNVVDCVAARERDICVSNIPAYSTDGVAQLVFALLLEMTNAVALHSDSVRGGEWSACPHFCYWKTNLCELANKTFGIIGFGKIGSAVAAIANGFKMRVIAYSPNTKTYDGFGKVEFVSLNEVIEESDVISLHCPLTEDTKELVNSDFLKRMKKTAMLINTSRGQVVNESDLANALNEGEIAYAGLDVLCAEPARADNPLLKAKNCFITPHIAWASFEARTRLMNIFKGNVEAFLSGEPTNVVN